MNQIIEKNRRGQGLSVNVLIIAAIALLVLVVLSVLLLNRVPEVVVGVNNSSVVDADVLFQERSFEYRLISKYQPDRSLYGYGNLSVDLDGDGVDEVHRFLISDLTKNICDNVIPSDFWKFKYSVMTSTISQDDFNGLSECYYNQPEWIGDRYVQLMDKKYRYPNPNHWTPEGFGVFPHEMVVYTRPGEVFDLYTFFHTSFGVERYQGVKLVVVYPEVVSDVGNKSVVVSGEDSGEFLSGVVSPDNVITSPTYPLFVMGWNKRINLNVRVANNTPIGDYSIGFDVVKADLWKELEWREIYGPYYQPLGFSSVDQAYFKVLVKVR